MQDKTEDLDQGDEDIFTCTASDETLEAAAGAAGANMFPTSPIPATTIACC